MTIYNAGVETVAKSLAFGNGPLSRQALLRYIEEMEKSIQIQVAMGRSAITFKKLKKAGLRALELLDEAEENK
jgi:hypothetical protein